MPTPKGRADTDEKKRAIIERVIVAWQSSPYQRLGQFIDNAVHAKGRELFHVEDEDLARMLEEFVKSTADPNTP